MDLVAFRPSWSLLPVNYIVIALRKGIHLTRSDIAMAQPLAEVISIICLKVGKNPRLLTNATKIATVSGVTGKTETMGTHTRN